MGTVRPPTLETRILRTDTEKDFDKSLELAAAHLRRGDVAVVPAVTFLATANAIRLAGAEVAIADVDPTTGLLNQSYLSEAVERVGRDRVKAVLPVHLNGQCADMPALVETARGLGLGIIEDACHALGGGYEIALACHRRIALSSPRVKIGLPEAMLGLMPGAGGVVRMVRMLGC